MLEFDGHEVEVVGGAEEALAAFGRSSFDLTLLDYEMPNMKGDQLAIALKTIAPHHPIIMFTGYAEAVTTSGSPLKAVDLVLGKPFHLEELRRALARLLPPA
jgi:CheY-like chemotaxis protein